MVRGKLHNYFYEKFQILFDGVYVPANSLPYNYILTWVLISTPLLYTILFVVGYIQIFKRFFSRFVNPH